MSTTATARVASNRISAYKYKRIIVNRKRQLELVEEDVPNPGAAEVRLRILAAGVSYADVLMCQGVHPEARRPPFTPGWDVVGVVDALGEGVQSMPLGTTVAAMPIVGGYAEYLCLPARGLVCVPPQLDAAEAVCLILNYVTAYQMLHRSAQAKPGETALIHSAAGGVGTALLQLARLHSVETYGTASTGKLSIVENFGGHAIDYKRSDFLEVIRRSAKGGVDIVFDGLGDWNLLRSWRELTPGGRLVAYRLTSSLSRGKRDLKGLLSTVTAAATMYTVSLLSRRKRLSIYSIQMLQRRRPDWFRQDLTTLFGLLERGELKPVIDRRLSLEQVAFAHELLGKGQTIGKIVLVSP